MRPVLLRLAADAALVAALLLVPAGTVAWGRAWGLLAVLLGVRIASAVVVHRVHPALLRERARLPLHREQPWTDRVLVTAVLATGFVGLPIVAARDVFHWRLLPAPPPPVAALGLLLFALGWTLKGLALRENAFATAVLRLQGERGHVVVDSGVYGVVRHPFYAGTVLVLVGLGPWLGSYVAALAAVVPIGCLVARLALEERLLRRALPGYRAYAARVRHRLLPGVW